MNEHQLHHLNIVMRAVKGIVDDDKMSDEEKIRLLGIIL
jgi:hypothetical protein